MQGLIYFLSLAGVSLALPSIIKTPLEAMKFGAPPSGSSCSNVHLQKCQYDFNKALGISTELDWHKPIDFKFTLLNILQTQQQAGLVKICTAYTDFANCLGPTYAACTSVITFIKDDGLDPIMASFYPAVLAQLHFQCGGGLETLLTNWQCITNQEVLVNKTLQACNFAYTLNITNDPSHACGYAKDLMQCVRQPFQSPCGPAASWFMCETTRAGIQTHLPYCSLRCTVTSSSSQEFELKASGMTKEEGLAAAMDTVKNSPHMKTLQAISAHATAEENAAKEKPQ